MTEGTEPALARRERLVIVLLALLQGLALYVVEYADAHNWALLSGLAGQVPWYTLVLTVPTLMQLSLQRLDDRLFWTNTALTLALFGSVAAWATWRVTAAPGTTAASILGPFAVSVAIVAFVGLPYLQVRLSQRRFSAPYPELFAHAWQNALTLAVAGIMVAIVWLLLLLWQELFKLIGIDFFARLFGEDAFIYLVNGLLFGLGVLVARTQHRAMQIGRQVVLAVFTGFLPLASFIALIFLISLPFTGFAPLQRAASTAFTVSALVAALILLLNAVVQTGRDCPYPRPLRWLIDCVVVALPILAGIAIYAVIVRISAEGWTTDRFWALLAVGLLGAYAIGYALAIFRRTGSWMAGVPRVNVVVSVVLIALGVLANSPLLDPTRIAVGSQLARIEAVASDGTVDDATRSRIEYLRFDSGRSGAQAMQQLHDLSDSSPTFVTVLAEIAARPARYAWQVDALDDQSPDELARRIAMAPDQAPLPAALIAALANGEVGGRSPCTEFDGSCVAQWLDVDLDQQADVVLCAISDAGIQCTIYVEANAQWRKLGSVTTGPTDTATRDAVRQGLIRIVPRQVQDLQFGDSEPVAIER